MLPMSHLRLVFCTRYTMSYAEQFPVKLSFRTFGTEFFPFELSFHIFELSFHTFGTEFLALGIWLKIESTKLEIWPTQRHMRPFRLIIAKKNSVISYYDSLGKKTMWLSCRADKISTILKFLKN